MEKRELSCTVGGNVNWCSHYGEQYGGSSKKLIIELPYDPAIPLLGIYSKKKNNPLTHKDTCTPVLIATLFTTAETWKQPKCPSTDDWLKKKWYIYILNGILLWHRKE